MTRLHGDVNEIYSKLPQPTIQAGRAFSASIWEDGRIDAPLREMIRMRSAQMSKCVA